MRSYVEAAMRQDAVERLDRMMDARVALVGGEPFTSHARALEDRAGIDRAAAAKQRDPKRVSLAEQARSKAARHG